MKQLTSKVLSLEQITDQFYELSFPWDTETPLPGQFITIKCGDSHMPLLRRPFAFSRYDDRSGIASILFQRRGIATSYLSGLRVEDNLDIIGPLGNSFPFPEDTSVPVLIAGGIGMGPILFLQEELLKRAEESRDEQKPEPLLFIGARTASMLPSELFLKSYHCAVATDDGSRGYHGTSVDLADSHLQKENYIFFSCGPTPMMKAVYRFAGETSSPCWVSMEQMMACGVGACMGCTVKVKGEQEYARVCKEGPVFDGGVIEWT